MKYIILLLLTIILIETKIIAYLKEQKDIQYSNYQNCLRALESYDENLSSYLEREKK